MNFLSNIAQICEQHSTRMLSALRLVVIESREAFRSVICEMMNIIDDSTQKRIRVICEICGSYNKLIVVQW